MLILSFQSNGEITGRQVIHRSPEKNLADTRPGNRVPTIPSELRLRKPDGHDFLRRRSFC